jgi:excisionase family DNA binding protein
VTTVATAKLRSVRELMTALLEEPALSVDETAVLLSLSRGGAYEGVRAGQIPCIRIGRCIRVPCSALRAMLGVERKERPEEVYRRKPSGGDAPVEEAPPRRRGRPRAKEREPATSET